MDRYPLVLGPVVTAQPFAVGFDIGGVAQVAAIIRDFRLAGLVNLLGLPAAAVPVGVANGLPQGVQIIGRAYREDLCLDAAEAVEARLGVLTPIDPRAAGQDATTVSGTAVLDGTAGGNRGSVASRQ